MRWSRAASVAVLLLALAPGGQAADTTIGEVLDLAKLAGAFPAEFSPVDQCLSPDQLLFVAGGKSVLVWTPWGWEPVWAVPKEHEFEKVKAIGFALRKTGDRLLIVTTRGLRTVTWDRRERTATEWGKAEQVFRAESVGEWPTGFEPDSLAANPYPAKVEGAVVACVADRENRLYAVRSTEPLSFVPVGPVGSSVVFSPSGYALVWGHRGKTVTILEPTGRAVSEVHIEPALARDELEKKNITVRCGRIDEQRGIWLVGTSHGLAVGRIDQTSNAPDSQLHRVGRPGTASVVALGSFLGRTLLVTDGDEKGTTGGVSVEDGFGTGPTDPIVFAKDATFSQTPAAPEMGRPGDAVMVAPDVVWATAANGVWEWSPGRWQHLGGDIGLPRPRDVFTRPVVVADRIRSDRLWCVRPRASDRFRELSVVSGPLTATAHGFCPDPSGGGVWAWEGTPSKPDLGYVRFATPHALSDTRPDGTAHPANFTVSRLTHRLADHTTRTPDARNDALLLPTGADFLLGRAGYWVEVDRSALAGGPFRELTPGAGSAEAAWLAVKRDGDRPQRLVSIDIDPDAAGRPTLVVTDLKLDAPAADEVTLVPDSSGSVWFARKEKDGAGWVLRRIHPMLPDRGPTLTASSLGEAPRYLFLSPVEGWTTDGFLLTDTGGCRIAHSDRIDPPAGFQLLTPSVGPWARYWQTDPLDPDGRHEYEGVVSRRWGSVAGEMRLILLRRPTGSPKSEAYGVAVEGEGLRIESAAARLERGPLRGLRPRWWFSGGNEFVVGYRESGPEKSGRLLTLPVDGVSAIRTSDWPKPLAGNLDPDWAAFVSDLRVNTLGDAGAGTLVAAEANRIAFDDVSAVTRSPVTVPTSVEVHRPGGQSERYDVRRELPTMSLPVDATHMTVRVAPDYGDWWRPDWNRVFARDKLSPNGETFPLTPDGLGASFQVPLSPGVRRELAVATDAWPELLPFELPELAIDVANLPASGVSPWWLLAVVPLAFAVVGVAVAASHDFYHRLTRPFGFRWVFSGADGNASVFVRSDGDGGAFVRRPDGATTRPTAVPPSPDDFADLVGGWRESAEATRPEPFLVTAYVDQALFRYNWSACFSDGWADPTGRVFAGLFFGMSPGEHLPTFPPRKGKMVVTALACGVRGGEPTIANGDLIVRESLYAFEKSTFRVIERSREATHHDFITALKESDICIVVAHAKDGSFHIKDEDFGAAEWSALVDDVRCRLLIVVGCGLGDLASPASPLLFAVVQRGVTCLACTREKQDTVVAKHLLTAFCKEWRRGRSRGPTVAGALRLAAAMMPDLGDPDHVTEQVNSYVILGNPTLRLEYRRASGGTTP